MTEVGDFQAKVVAEVLGADTRCGVELVRDVRPKVDVGALGAIEELEISNEWRLREDVLQIPDLTPTIVSHHDIRDEAGVA